MVVDYLCDLFISYRQKRRMREGGRERRREMEEVGEEKAETER